MLIKSQRVWIDEKFRPATIEIGQTKITTILPYDVEANFDYDQKRILPGFIDIHSHGAYGFDTNDGLAEGIKDWALRLPKEGVTAFCPTTITQSEEVLSKALSNVAEVMSFKYSGAEILGVHLEGPYINRKYKGSQPEQFIVEPNIEQFERLQKAAKGHIVYVTLAPEKDKNYTFIEYLNSHNIVASLGHSDATYNQAYDAYIHGAKSMTHVYNAMSGFNHRENGMVGAALNIKDMYGEIIADLKHSTPVALKIFADAKGPKYTIMISDSLSIKGLPIGTKKLFGGQEITLSDEGIALLNNGTIAGSTLHMNIGLKNMIEEAYVDEITAINSCTINPARCLGVASRKGSIEANKDADLVILDDDYTVIQTYIKGKTINNG